MSLEISTQLASIAEGTNNSSVEDRSATARTPPLEVQSSLETIVRELEALSSTIAPINRLPVELLQAIFKITFPTRTKLAHVLETLRVTHVCRYWRTVAHSYTGFWSNIYIDDTPPALVARCLELGGQSLHVYIDICVKTSLSRSFHTVKRILRPNDIDSINLLPKHSERVRTLDFNAPFQHKKLLAPVIDAFRTLFPHVDHLSWSDLSGWEEDLVAIPYPLPRLRHLSLYRCSGIPIINEVSGLKSLRWMLEDVPMRTFVELLQRNEGLESITMRDCVYATSPRDPIPYEPQPVSLPNLKSLTISNCDKTVLYLDAPLLSSLPVLRACHYEETRDHIGFWFSSPVDPSLSLKATPGCLEPIVATELAPFWEGVTTFGLHRSISPSPSKGHRYPEGVVDIWKLLPRLRVPEVTWSHGSDKVLQPLRDSTEVCPNLSRIEISPSDELTDGLDAQDFFVGLLESRAARGKHISEIVLSHKLNSDGSPNEFIPLHPRDWIRGYPTSPEVVYHPSSRCLDTFWAYFIECCQGFLRPT